MAASATHPSLQELLFSFDWLEQPAAVAALLDAVVDVALARRLRSVTLDNAELTPAAVPALVRLLGSSALTELRVVNHGAGSQLLDDPAAALLAGALRRNSTLTSLALRRVGLFDIYHAPRAAQEVLGALVAHPSLRTLGIARNRIARSEYEDEGSLDTLVGGPVAALVAANAPALQELDFERCDGSYVFLGPVFEALAYNTHLRTLRCSSKYVSASFVRDVLPTVRANKSRASSPWFPPARTQRRTRRAPPRRTSARAPQGRSTC